jgi:hypothetical protein
VREADLEIAVRCGGHSIVGHSMTGGGMIGLSPLSQVATATVAGTRRPCDDELI